MACELRRVPIPHLGDGRQRRMSLIWHRALTEDPHSLMRLQLKQFIEQWERFMDMETVNKKRQDLKPIAKETP